MNQEPTAAPRRSGFTSTQWVRIQITLLVASVLWAYGDSIRGQFVLDDYPAIHDNAALRDWFPSVEKIPTFLYNRPVGRWSFTLNALLIDKMFREGGLEVGLHVGNILIHACAGLLLYGLVRRVLLLRGKEQDETAERRANWTAFAVALVWLVHPIQTGAVTYIFQRLEAQMAMFYLATLYCLLRGSQSARPLPWYAAAIACCGLGMGTKEVMFTIVPVGLLFDRIFLSGSWSEVLRKRGLVHGVFILFAAGLVVAAQYLPENFGAGIGHADGVTPWEHLRSQPKVLLYYVGLAFYPRTLLIDHGWPHALANDYVQIFGLGAVIVLLLSASCCLLYYRPRIGFVAISIFLILAPTSSILPMTRTACDYRMYLPLAGLVILVVLGVESVARRLVADPKIRQWACLGLLVLAAGGLAMRTRARNVDFQIPFLLWDQVVAVYPKYSLGLVNRGVERERIRPPAKMDAKAAQEAAARQLNALSDYQQARQFKPDYYVAYRKEAAILLRLGSYDDALARLHDAAKLERGDDFFVVWGLARAAAGAGKLAEAQEHGRRCLERAQNEMERGQARLVRGEIQLKLQRPGEAIAEYEQAVQISEKLSSLTFKADAMLGLGQAYLELGQWNEAATWLGKADQLRSPHRGTLLQLAWLRAAAADGKFRDGEEAKKLAGKVFEIWPDAEPGEVFDALAAAYAQSASQLAEGPAAQRKAADLEYADAIRFAEKSLAAYAKNLGKQQAVEARLKLYKQHQPYRRPAAQGG